MNIQTLWGLKDDAGNLLLSAPKKPKTSITIDVPPGLNPKSFLQIYMYGHLFFETSIEQKHLDAGKIEYEINENGIQEI